LKLYIGLNCGGSNPTNAPGVRPICANDVTHDPAKFVRCSAVDSAVAESFLSDDGLIPSLLQISSLGRRFIDAGIHSELSCRANFHAFLADCHFLLCRYFCRRQTEFRLSLLAALQTTKSASSCFTDLAHDQSRVRQPV
jgi:hypothetical protein